MADDIMRPPLSVTPDTLLVRISEVWRLLSKRTGEAGAWLAIRTALLTEDLTLVGRIVHFVNERAALDLDLLCATHQEEVVVLPSIPARLFASGVGPEQIDRPIYYMAGEIAIRPDRTDLQLPRERLFMFIERGNVARLWPGLLPDYERLPEPEQPVPAAGIAPVVGTLNIVQSDQTLAATAILRMDTKRWLTAAVDDRAKKGDVPKKARPFFRKLEADMKDAFERGEVEDHYKWNSIETRLREWKLWPIKPAKRKPN